MSIACERAGVEFFGIHAIRHLAASLADAAGKSLTDIQGLLRHKSASTTSRYLHKLRGIKVDFGGAFNRPAAMPVEVAINDEPKEIGQPASPGRPIFKLILGGRKPTKAP